MCKLEFSGDTFSLQNYMQNLKKNKDLKYLVNIFLMIEDSLYTKNKFHTFIFKTNYLD